MKTTDWFTTLSANRFPWWPKLGALSCFNCAHSLEDSPEQDKGYPAGHGRYRRTCHHCGLHTYYDHQPTED